VGVGQNENTQAVLRFFRCWHSAQSYLYKLLRAAHFGRMFRCMR
jgi:hypothetical protein